jgi:ABC-type lipoprotein release transport system permease subunit
VRAWIERQRYLLDFTISSLGRRKAKNAALLCVYSALVFTLASIVLFTHALRTEAAALLRGAPEIVVQRMAAGRHDLIPQEHAAKLSDIRGVGRVQPRLWGYYFDPIAKANYTVLVPEAFWGPSGQVAIGSGLARARGIERADRLPIAAHDGTLLHLLVREVMPSESELVAADLLLVGEADFRRIFGTPPGLFTDVAVSVSNEREISTIAAKVRDALPDSRTITRPEIARTYDSLFDWRSGFLVAVLSSTVFAFAIVVWDKASGLSAEERREIGVLKAIGWETSDVLRMKFWEGVVISAAAFAVGMIGAYVHVFFAGIALFAPVLEGWSGLYPEYRLAPFVSAYDVATILALTVVPYTVATIVPSWRAATIDPDSVMRS